MEEFHVAGVQFAHFLSHQEKGKAHRCQHAESLEDIHPNHGLYAAPYGVKPHQQYAQQHRYPEGNADGPHQQQLQRGADQKQAGRCPQDLGDEKEPGAGFVGGHSEALVQVFIDGYHIEFEVQRTQYESDDQIAQEEAHNHLEIAEAGYIHHTGDGHEGNTRQAGPDHGDGHFPPGRRTGCVKIFVVLCHLFVRF